MAALSRPHDRKPRVETPFRDALVALLDEPAPGGDGTQLDQVVVKLIEKAKSGDWHAMKEIFDRLDRRPEATGEAEETQGPRLIVTGVPRPPRTGNL